MASPDKPNSDGAPEPSAPATAVAAPSAMSLWLPWAIALVVMPALAYGFSMFVLLPRLQKSLGVAPVAAAASPAGHGEENKPAGGHGAEGEKQTVPMTKLLVNVSGTLGARYLLTSVTLVGSSADFRTKLEQNDAQLRDMACGLLAAKTIADLEKPGARNLIRSELLAGFNHALGAPLVKEIYITEFAIQ